MVDIPEDELGKDDLPFPHSRIVNMVRQETADGQYVRKSVYHGLNLLLGRIADDIIENMVQTDNAYIEKHDLDRASMKYENIEAVMREKERIIKHLHALQEDVNKLARDIERAGLE